MRSIGGRDAASPSVQRSSVAANGEVGGSAGRAPPAATAASAASVVG